MGDSSFTHSHLRLRDETASTTAGSRMDGVKYGTIDGWSVNLGHYSKLPLNNCLFCRKAALIAWAQRTWEVYSHEILMSLHIAKISCFDLAELSREVVKKLINERLRGSKQVSIGWSRRNQREGPFEFIESTANINSPLIICCCLLI